MWCPRTRGAREREKWVIAVGVVAVLAVALVVGAVGTPSNAVPVRGTQFSTFSTPTNREITATALNASSSPGWIIQLSGSATGGSVYSWSGSDGSSSSATNIIDTFSKNVTWTFKACDTHNNCATLSIKAVVSPSCTTDSCAVAIGCFQSSGCPYQFSPICFGILWWCPGTTTPSLSVMFMDSVGSGNTLVAPLSYAWSVGVGTTVITGNPAAFQYSSAGTYTVGETITEGNGHHAMNDIWVTV